MRKLESEKRALVIKMLVEGMSINATARTCSVNKRTVLRLLADLGRLCRDYHDLTVRRLTCRRVQVDEIWSFVGCKQRSKERGCSGHGDAWTWIGMDADTKLVVAYLVGERDAACANEFIIDLAERITNRVQLTSDGHLTYLKAVENAFGNEIDYAQLVKLYGPESGPEGPERKYSPGKCNGTRKDPQIGLPNPEFISTSYIERQNLSLRMGNRRHTRLTNAHSKKLANHAHAIALHYFHYNFIRRHLTLKTTPAVAAGIADREWTVDDLVAMLEAEEWKLGKGRRINRDDQS